jgi:hypothetical protein
VAGSGGLRDLRHCLILRCAQTVFKATLAAIQQSIQHLDLFGVQVVVAM